jgi:hypothetical protein
VGRQIHQAVLLLVAAAAVAILVFGCGRQVSGPVQPAPKLRTDLLFGYYGGCATTVLENAGHVNTHWATGWCGTGTWHLDVAQELSMARGAGVRNIVLALPHGLVWAPGAEAEVRFQLVRLQQAGALDGWDSIMVYPADEPEIPENGSRSDSEVRGMVGWLRGVLSAFPALLGAPVGVIYGCNSRAYPAIDAFDWVGCDDYPSGCRVTDVSRAYDDLARSLRPEQRLMVVAGGADPWRQDPACFESYAHGHPKVVMLVGFIWQDFAAPGVGAGIRSNGLRRLYCEAGRRVRYGSAAGCV